MLGPSWAPGIAQQVKAVVRGPAAPIDILTGHDGCLFRMEVPLTLRPSGGNAGFEPVGWRRTLTMHDAIIGIALAGDGRMCSVHPGIDRVMSEEIREDRAAPPLRDPLSPLDEGPILALHRGLEPPCHLQEDPWTGRMLVERPQEQRMITVVETLTVGGV
jgi:hypothetical protein